MLQRRQQICLMFLQTLIRPSIWYFRTKSMLRTLSMWTLSLCGRSQAFWRGHRETRSHHGWEHQLHSMLARRYTALELTWCIRRLTKCWVACIDKTRWTDRTSRVSILNRLRVVEEYLRMMETCFKCSIQWLIMRLSTTIEQQGLENRSWRRGRSRVELRYKTWGTM